MPKLKESQTQLLIIRTHAAASTLEILISAGGTRKELTFFSQDVSHMKET